jgi:hypothetical protein
MNYENLKTSYLEMKNQYELINLKFQNLTEENFSMKRESINLSKEINSKQDLIDTLKSEILNLNKNKINNNQYSYNISTADNYNNNNDSFISYNNTNTNNSMHQIRNNNNNPSNNYNFNNNSRDYDTSKSNRIESNSLSGVKNKSNTIEYDDVRENQ